jgi:NADH:ubiquinone oxidoreductase subunit 2 (subunit N)
MVISLIVESSMSPLCLFMVIMSLISLFYYTRVCYAVLRQSSSISLMRPCSVPSGWWGSFIVVGLVLGLVLAPIFVMWM